MFNLRKTFRKVAWLFVIGAALSAGAEASAAESYWIGITPWQKGQSSDEIDRLYLPMIKYLKEKTGAEIKIRTMASYENTIEQIASGAIQLAAISPSPYIKAKKINPGLEILVTELSWNADKTAKQDSYQSIVLALKGRSEIVDLNSLKQKKFAFVSMESTSGYRVPLTHFRDMNINPTDFLQRFITLGVIPPSRTPSLPAASTLEQPGITTGLKRRRKMETSLRRFGHLSLSPIFALSLTLTFRCNCVEKFGKHFCKSQMNF